MAGEAAVYARQTGAGQGDKSAVALVDNYVGFDVWDPEPFRRCAAGNDFRIAGNVEMPAVHALSEDIMKMPLASLSAMTAAHRQTEATAWLHETMLGEGRRTPTGIILLLPLTWDGEAALRTGAFKFSEPPMGHLCRPGDEMAALYLWLCAGADRTARRNIMRTAEAWFSGPCADRRVYGRAATDEGLQAFAGFGFRRLSAVRRDIFFLPPGRAVTQ